MRSSFANEGVLAQAPNAPSIELLTPKHFARRGGYIIVAALLKSLVEQLDINGAGESYREIWKHLSAGKSLTHLSSASLRKRGILVKASLARVDKLKAVWPKGFNLSIDALPTKGKRRDRYAFAQNEVSPQSSEVTEDLKRKVGEVIEGEKEHPADIIGLISEKIKDPANTFIYPHMRRAAPPLLKNLYFRKSRRIFFQKNPSTSQSRA